MKRFPVLTFLTLSLIAVPMAKAQDFVSFETHTIDKNIGKVCYGLVTADVNNDQKLDIVAAADSAVYWYENPTWKRHVVISGQTELDNVCIAAHDIDGDGKVDFALGAGWTKVGTIQWLSRTDDPGKPWNVYPIAVERWTHRMRFAHVLGKSKPQLVVSPLNKTVGAGVRLTAFEIPADPRKDRWLPTVINPSLNRMHNHWHTDFNDDNLIDTITASEEGVSLVTKSKGSWHSTSITSPGAGEVKTGRLAGGKRIIATIEPMHGTQAVVYCESGSKDWQRTVLDDSLKQGHAVWCADLTGDGADEILIGHREAGTGKIKGPGLYVFQATDSSGSNWKKHVIDDGGIAVEDALIADLNDDGRPDIIAGGRATRNVKIYLNLGK